MKIDIIEFVETQLGIELFEYQKELLRKMYEAGPNATIVYPRHLGRNDYRHLAEMTRMILKGETK